MKNISWGERLHFILQILNDSKNPPFGQQLVSQNFPGYVVFVRSYSIISTFIHNQIQLSDSPKESQNFILSLIFGQFFSKRIIS